MRYLRFFGILSKVTGNEPGEIQAAKSSRGQSYPGRKMDEHINTMKKQEVHIRGLRIGGGRSCICVPLTAKTLPLLDAELASLYSFRVVYVIDTETERARDRAEVAAGLLAPYEYRMRWKGENEETAREKCAASAAAPTEEEGE